MEEKKKSNKRKIIISIVVAIVVIIAIIGILGTIILFQVKAQMADNMKIEAENKPTKRIEEMSKEEMLEVAEKLDEKQLINDILYHTEEAKKKYVGKVYKITGWASEMTEYYDYTRLHITGGMYPNDVVHGYFELRFKDKEIKNTISTNDFITIVGEIEAVSNQLANNTPFMGTNYAEFRAEGKIKNAYLIENKH